MERVVLAAVLTVFAAVAAFVLQRRRPQAPASARWQVPSLVQRSDFADPELPWLVAVFTSAGCSVCARALERAREVVAPDVVVEEIELGDRPELHRKYSIDAVPLVVVADNTGAVRASHVGAPGVQKLQQALSSLRVESAPGPAAALPDQAAESNED